MIAPPQRAASSALADSPPAGSAVIDSRPWVVDLLCITAILAT